MAVEMHRIIVGRPSRVVRWPWAGSRDKFGGALKVPQGRIARLWAHAGVSGTVTRHVRGLT